MQLREKRKNPQRLCGRYFLYVPAPLPEFAVFEVVEVLLVLVRFFLKGYVHVSFPMWLSLNAVTYIKEGVQQVEEYYQGLNLLAEVDTLVVDYRAELLLPHFFRVLLEDYEWPERYAVVVFQDFVKQCF